MHAFAQFRTAFSVAAATLCFALAIQPLAAQTETTGTIAVTVRDPSGAVIPQATLELRDLGTNLVRKATTPEGGGYTFVNLPFGQYQLTITANGFEREVFNSVQVQTARATEIAATLKVGGATETVEVSVAATPLVETASSTLATTVDTKQVVDLPIQGRNVFNLAFSTPGFSVTPLAVVSQTTLSQGPQDNTIPMNGTYNNLPGAAIVGATLDGVPGISNRFKSAGFSYGAVIVQPRLENIAEMTVQTGQMDLSGGVGTSALQINLVTRRGTNQFHGRLFEDLRNTDFNANTWINNATNLPRNIIKFNDFGGSVGGPIIKNKLFFYGSLAESLAPLSKVSSATVLSSSAQQGIFSYKTASGALQTANVLQIAGAAGYSSTVLPNVAAQFAQINGVLTQGTLSPTTDPNVSTLNHVNAARQTIHYPSLRLDYNLAENKRLSFVYNQTSTTCVNCNVPIFPGGIAAADAGSVDPFNRIVSFTFDWSIHPTLINQFRAGYTGQYSNFNPENQGVDLTKLYTQTWAYGTSTSPLQLPVSSYYPLLSWNDSVMWEKGVHSFTFGATWWREQDHYWNSPSGYPRYTFGVASVDPIAAVFTSALGSAGTTPLANAEALYATLTGRISAVSTTRPLDFSTKQYKPFGQYNLDEVQMSEGFFFQDRWRLASNFTVNYGLRWDIIGDDHDVHGDYTSSASVADLWGPTTTGVSFAPGALGGPSNPTMVAAVHHYKTAWKNPEPAIAIAWTPRPQDGGFLNKILGKDQTVVRAGYSLRFYNEGQQNFWAFGSSSGAFFYQSDALTPTTATGPGNFLPGTLTFGDPLPPYLGSPATWAPQIPQANTTFSSTAPWGFNPNIRAPYVEEWNIGIQRQLGASNAIEVRYVGNAAMHAWTGYNINEVNIFENGFLTDFQAAQNNLAINIANGKGNTFANNGLAGQRNMPVMAAAFGGTTGSNYTNGTYVTYLQTGQAGAMANNIAGNQAFVCNMFGANFSPCAARGTTGPGAGLPINFFQVNPYATGRAVQYEDSSGHSNYNGMQVEFRQRLNHGMQFNINYTLSHSLGLIAQNAIQGQGSGNSALYFTNRDFRLNYSPSAFDVRHVVHISGTYDIPVGKGRTFLNSGGILDKVIGGWTLGLLSTIETGFPVVLNGGYDTMNQNDSGVVFQNGLTVSQVQSSMGVYHTGSPWAYYINPKYIASNGAANFNYIAPETTAGQYGYHPTFYGPHWFGLDSSLNKSVPIRERLRFAFQAEFLNILNHPTWGAVTTGTSAASVQSLSFGQTTGGPTSSRVLEFRANIEF